MRLPFVIPRSGQKSLSRFVSRTSLPATSTVAVPDVGIEITRFPNFQISKLRRDSFYRREFRGTGAVADGTLDRCVRELLARAGAAQEQPTAAHVPAADA